MLLIIHFILSKKMVISVLNYHVSIISHPKCETKSSYLNSVFGYTLSILHGTVLHVCIKQHHVSLFEQTVTIDFMICRYWTQEHIINVPSV